jgi:hypothetical protein
MDFMANTDILGILIFFNEKVLTGRNVGAHVPEGAVPTGMPIDTSKAGGINKFLEKLGGDARQMDTTECEAQFKTEPKILMDDEKVEMAFKCGRDAFLLTSKRILRIDVQGWTGKRVEYRSILWSTIRAFSIETAGSWDRDVDMMIFTNIKSMPRIEQDFRKGCVDVYAVQKFFTDKLLGLDTAAHSGDAVSMAGHTDAGSGNMFAWLGDDSRMIDATKVNQQFHAFPPILQQNEHVEMAFKGRRDMTLFTTKRLLFVDLKGWSGKKAEYFTLPWKNVQAYGVRSAGSWMDKDSEMMIWTDINDVFYPPKQGDNPPPPPIPRYSFLEVDFQKDKVDLMAIQRYLSARCLHVAGGGYLSPEVDVAAEVMQASPPNSVEGFLNWLGDDARAIDPQEMDDHLHFQNPMLQLDEHVVMAFKCGRDSTILTTKRVLVIDVQGWTGKKVEYKSIPYPSIRAFSVESAGSWDRDAEFKLSCKTYWLNNGPGSTFAQDLRKGRADIIAIQSFIAAQVIGHDEGRTTAPSIQGGSDGSPGGVTAFLQWLGDDARQIEPSAVNEELHKTVPILQSDETVDLAFKVGRDLCVFTTKRLLLIDVQGWTGKKVEYKSFPLASLKAFEVETAGKIAVFDSARMSVFTDVPGIYKVSQDLTKDQKNVWDVHTFLSKKMLPQPLSAGQAGREVLSASFGASNSTEGGYVR